MPYFVQLKYWKGVAYKGLATLDVKALDRLNPNDKVTREKLTVRASLQFDKAIEQYNAYELQDPIFQEIFLDRYYCYRYTNRKKEALGELVKFLINENAR